MSIFNIKWSVSKSEWDKARIARQLYPPGSRYDRNYQAADDLLEGTVELTVNDFELFGAPCFFSVLDFALRLADLLDEGRFNDAEQKNIGLFEQADGSLVILFERENGGVQICANHTEHRLHVSQDSFIKGIEAFLNEFAHAVKSTVPALFDWECMTALRAH